MKLLLTSGGLKDPALVSALERLAGRSTSKLRLAVVPTAANIQPGSKAWLVEQLSGLGRLGFATFDIVDPSALDKAVWMDRLTQADVIFISGGNTPYLLAQMIRTGLAQALPSLLASRIYVGHSAGSYVATPDITAHIHGDTYGAPTTALGLVDFGMLVHLGSPKYGPEKSEAALREQAVHSPRPVYVIDDDSAVLVDGTRINLVGPGQHFLVKPS